MKEFPLAKADGLIEVHHECLAYVRGREFPLAKADGLIEVGIYRRLGRLLRFDFRWRKPTASLKSLINQGTEAGLGISVGESRRPH